MKKGLSVILAFAMVLSIFPASIAFAADGDITYDFLAAVEKAAAASDEVTGGWAAGGNTNTYFDSNPNLAQFMPEGISVNTTVGSGVTNTVGEYLWQKNLGLRINNLWSDWSTNSRWDRNRFALDLEISDAQAGWYRPNVKFYASDFPGNVTIAVYMISGSDAKYLGELTSASNGADLNPVELSAGTHTLLFGVCSGPAGNLAMYFENITLKKLDEAPAMSTFSANIPTTVAHNATADITVESATMSDGRAYSFAEYAAAATGGCTGLDTTSTDNYILVESSDTTVATVKRVSANEWTLTPVKEGETTITVTPYYGGVAQTDLKQTKTLSVTYPNSAITGNNVTIGLTAVVDGVVNDAAKALLAESDVVAGNVKSVKVGDTVSLKAADSETLKFLYWYNGNSKRILSDEKEYSFIAGTNTPVFARYANTNALLEEYFTAAGQLTEGNSEDFELKVERPYYKLYKEKTAAPVAATTVNDATAVYWTKEGKIVSYNTSYTFIPWGNATEAFAVKEGVKSDVPAVVLFTSGNSYMLERVNIDAEDVIEQGILFGGSKTIDSCLYKAVARDNTNQFTATGDGEARAYVIYRDGATIRVAYSD